MKQKRTKAETTRARWTDPAYGANIRKKQLESNHPWRRKPADWEPLP